VVATEHRSGLGNMAADESVWKPLWLVQREPLYRTLVLRGDVRRQNKRTRTMDELHFDELSVRITQEKMDNAFCIAMQRAIDAGEEQKPTVVSKRSSIRSPKSTITI
jgi:hypothetical protein